MIGNFGPQIWIRYPTRKFWYLWRNNLFWIYFELVFLTLDSFKSIIQYEIWYLIHLLYMVLYFDCSNIWRILSQFRTLEKAQSQKLPLALPSRSLPGLMLSFLSSDFVIRCHQLCLARPKWPGKFSMLGPLLKEPNVEKNLSMLFFVPFCFDLLFYHLGSIFLYILVQKFVFTVVYVML